ncbi:MAG: methyl-accepting chemotaxis protein [Ignavibacteria bacterium]
MKWFLNRSIKNKLYISFGVIFIFIFFMFLNINNQLGHILEKQKIFAEKDYVVSVTTIELRSHLDRQRAQILEMMLSKDRKTQKEIEKEMNARRILVFALLDTLKTTVKGDVYLERSTAGLATDIAEYRRGREQVEVPLIYANKIDEAVSYANGKQKIIFESLRNQAIAMDEYAKKEVNLRLAIVGDYMVALITEFIYLGIGLLALMVFIVFYLNKIIVRPLSDLKNISEKISQGDLFVEMPKMERTDEVGMLWTTFSEMIDTLRKLASMANKVAGSDLSIRLVPKSDKDVLAISLNSMVDFLMKIISDLSEAINVLTSASMEILSGTVQLSANASETASAIGETTATVEEVRRTSEMSNNKAKEVLEISRKANDFADAGKKSTEETINGINKVGSQMEIIATSITSLTEQSKAIGEIISTVNDIAGQSNLLSVNASIEAARAGEHGKAFGIVAQEIKSLAEQSKQATLQVKSVLNDIQNAISSVMLATEQGEKIVDAGIKLAEESEEAINNLAQIIGIAKDSAVQTSVIGQEQFVGMSQVALAMENIRTASVQSVSTTRDIEFSARNLKDLSVKLKETISIFKV